jgi:hypothetical protein
MNCLKQAVGLDGGRCEIAPALYFDSNIIDKLQPLETS